MHVAITGAAGRLGRRAVIEMLNAGHDVRAIDRIRPAMDLCPAHIADIRDLGQVCGVLQGCDAVLHLAAIPSPRGYPQEEVFAVNALGTFNVVEAATLLGITRVIGASSASALGVAYATRLPVPLRYVPIDEAHPLLPQDAYGLSKLVGEDIVHAYHRRTGGAALSLRFPLIWDRDAAPDLLERLAADEAEGRHTLWSYIDVRDAARACRLTLEAPDVGDDVFYVAAPRTFMARPSASLARRHFPTLERIRGDDDTNWSFHDCARGAGAGLRGATPLPAHISLMVTQRKT
jgi:nucleoside-diphosphate-sugar epimerase